MNRYDVRFQSNDNRVWEVTLKADGISETDYLVKFWRRFGPWKLFRYTAHFINKDMLISVVGKPENK